jgi:hypothetical protein
VESSFRRLSFPACKPFPRKGLPKLPKLALLLARKSTCGGKVLFPNPCNQRRFRIRNWTNSGGTELGRKSPVPRETSQTSWIRRSHGSTWNTKVTRPIPLSLACAAGASNSALNSLTQTSELGFRWPRPRPPERTKKDFASLVTYLLSIVYMIPTKSSAPASATDSRLQAAFPSPPNRN